jgi:GNAT superfamily N-acetyltransferase
LPAEVQRVQLDALAEFLKSNEREARGTLYAFPVIWHEARYGFAVTDGGEIAGAGVLQVAASLGHIEWLIVTPSHRLCGVGRALLVAMAEAANYYNCHKMTVLVPHRTGAQAFFEACGYGAEAVLAQHTFKLDMAVMRKYVL